MSVPGHHALLYEIAGGVMVIAAALAYLLKKKKTKVIEDLTAEDMQRIDERLITGDVARSQSRFRRRYGVEAREKDFAALKPTPPVEPTSASPDERKD